MRRAISRPRRRGFATWLGYRLDRFLGLSPLVAFGHELPTFAHLLAAARVRGEVAIGVVEEPELSGAGAPATAPAACLRPRRDERFEVSGDARLVVVAPHGGSHQAHADAAAPRGEVAAAR